MTKNIILYTFFILSSNLLTAKEKNHEIPLNTIKEIWIVSNKDDLSDNYKTTLELVLDDNYSRKKEGAFYIEGLPDLTLFKNVKGLKYINSYYIHIKNIKDFSKLTTFLENKLIFKNKNHKKNSILNKLPSEKIVGVFYSKPIENKRKAETLIKLRKPLPTSCVFCYATNTEYSIIILNYDNTEKLTKQNLFLLLADGNNYLDSSRYNYDNFVEYHFDLHYIDFKTCKNFLLSIKPIFNSLIKEPIREK